MPNLDLDENTKAEVMYLAGQFEPLLGATILDFQVAVDKEEPACWPSFLLRLNTGKEIWVELSKDPEGNGPGTMLCEGVPLDLLWAAMKGGGG